VNRFNLRVILLWIALLVFIFSSGCNSTATEIPATPTSDPNAGLPTPLAHTTQVPEAVSTADAYLHAWQREDYEAMYSMLSTGSQQAISQEQFVQKYQSVADEAALKGVDYQNLSEEAIDDTTSKVAYQVSMHTNLIGDITRDTTMDLALEDGQWKVDWTEATILPELAGGNRLRMDLNNPARASIYDRNGNPLASQAEATSIGLYPDYVDLEASDGLFSLLSRVSGLRADTIRSRVENAQAGDYLPLGQILTDQAPGVLQALSQWGAVMISNYVSRFYPGNGIAPHLVGYVSALNQEELSQYRRKGYRVDEKVGRKGIERWGEDTLVGKHGGTLYVVDSEGKLVSELGSTGSEPGQSIYSTIDRDFQSGVQQALGGFKGAAVVLEQDTGKVLAMASSPGFDPNAYQTENINWQTTLGGIVSDPNLPEFNRAAQGLYPLGSVFKIITMAAGLESGQYAPDSTYQCNYIFDELAGLPLEDWTYKRFLEDGVTQPSGLLTLPQGLIRSCNPWFYHIGLDLYNKGLTTAVSDMARAFGLGSKTGIGVVDEEAGRVPDPENQVDATNLAIGQGNLQVTPLQVANFVAAIGNGGTLFRPQAIEKIVDAQGTPTFEFKPEEIGKLPIRPEYVKVIQDAMHQVTISKKPRGTGFLIFNGFGIPVAGKTGSAESQAAEPLSWFAGYTMEGREDKPDIAIAVLVEDIGEGSEYAAPIFRRIVELYFTGQVQKIYPWESTIGVTRSPTPLFSETPTPEPGLIP
jgi:cell division protein FtsI/penicillin-binding protein 2